MNKIIPIGGIGGAVGIIAIVVLISTPSINYASMSCEELSSQNWIEVSYTPTDGSEAKKQMENIRAISDIRQQKNCQDGKIDLNKIADDAVDNFLNPDTEPEPTISDKSVSGKIAETVEDRSSVDLTYDIDIKFDQTKYNSGDVAEIEIETDAPSSENIKVGVFDSAGDIIYETTAKPSSFGTTSIEFDLPEYYQTNEELEAIAFFTRDTDDKYTAITLVEGMRITELELDINTKKILSHTPSTVKFALSEAVSKDIMISVFDSDKNSLYMDTVTTNDFGIGKIEFTAPNYYLEDETVEIIASFVDDPSAERKISSTVGFTKTDLILTSDKTAYSGGDTVTITIATDPPVSTDILMIVRHVEGVSRAWYCFTDPAGNNVMDQWVASTQGKKEIQTNSNGMATITGEYMDDCNWAGGDFSFVTADARFEENKLTITFKK